MRSFSTFSLLYVTTLLTQTSTGFHITAKVLAWTLYYFIDQSMFGFSFSGPFPLLLNLKILAKRCSSSDLNHRRRVGEVPLSAEASPIQHWKRFGWRCHTLRDQWKGSVEQEAWKEPGVCHTIRGVFWEIIGRKFCLSESSPPSFYFNSISVCRTDFWFRLITQKSETIIRDNGTKTTFMNCFDKKHWLLKLFLLNLLQWETDGSAE